MISAQVFASYNLAMSLSVMVALTVGPAAVQATAFTGNTTCSEAFDAWRGEMGRSYGSIAEHSERGDVFCENLRHITEHNARNDASYTLGLNRFADLTREEFRSRHLSQPAPRAPRSTSPWVAPKKAELPAKLDWRESGAVTPVKNQGSCGSCWSFAATAAMEGAHKLAGNPLVSLSEQQLIDCEPTNLGCRGGLPPNAFAYVHENGGIEAEEAYPYEEGKADPPVCRFSKDDVVATFKDYEEPGYGGDETELQQALAAVGPIAISYDAGGDGDFQFYKSGVFTSTSCTTITDHAMTLVGYGALNGESYWLVKNQWGEDWGIGGYLMTKKGTNMCGVAEYSSYPTVDSSRVI